jgi:hypothetical protein
MVPQDPCRVIERLGWLAAVILTPLYLLSLVWKG